jgi:hypothetical protein
VRIDQRLIDRVEAAHAAYVAWRVEALGGTAERLPNGAVVARCAGHPDSWYANRIVAVLPADAADVIAAAADLRKEGLPVRVEVPKPLLDPPLAAALTGAGFAPAWSARALAARPVALPAVAPPDVHLERVETTPDAERFWDAYEACFEESQPERPTHVRMLADPSASVSAYMACSGKEVVAVALMATRDRVALLADAATRPDWRGRGLHTLLVAARLADAHELRADLVTSDVEPGGGSDRNLTRVGLEAGYVRDVWTASNG